MQAKTILLFNLNTIMLVSLLSDHWILIKIRQVEPPPNCQLEKIRQMSLLKCKNRTYALVDQHSSLFRQCHDMTEGYQRLVTRKGLLYPQQCYWFLSDFSQRWRAPASELYIDLFNVFCTLSSVILCGWAMHRSHLNKHNDVSRMMGASMTLFGLSIITTLHIIHGTNTRQHPNEGYQMYYAEAGWSLICAMITCILMGVSGYLNLKQHRAVLERQRSQRRRRQMHNAIMSSCRQEIAMAIRARMTVI